MLKALISNEKLRNDRLIQRKSPLRPIFADQGPQKQCKPSESSAA